MYEMESSVLRNKCTFGNRRQTTVAKTPAQIVVAEMDMDLN